MYELLRLTLAALLFIGALAALFLATYAAGRNCIEED